MGASAKALCAIVDGAYRPRPSLSSWLDSLVVEVASRFPEQLGAVARLWDGERLETVGDYAVCLRSARSARAFSNHRRRSAHRIDFLLGASGGRPASSRRTIARGAASDAYLRGMVAHFDGAGVYDTRHVTLSDEGALWLTLGIVQSEPSPLVGTPAQWRALGRHLGVAMQAQRCLDGLRTRLDGHGSAAAPALALREELCALDGGASGVSGTEAAQLWADFTEGAWCSIERFVDEGRVYHLLARNADPRASARALSRDERELACFVVAGKSMKWIALTTEVARSTVNARLAALLAKVGVRSALELIKAFRVEDDRIVPALALRAHALGPGTYLLAFDLARSSCDVCSPIAALTPAQSRVVHLALDGLGDRRIAERLGVSRHTVSHHLRDAFVRLGVGSRAELFSAISR